MVQFGFVISGLDRTVRRRSVLNAGTSAISPQFSQRGHNLLLLSLQHCPQVDEKPVAVNAGQDGWRVGAEMFFELIGREASRAQAENRRGDGLAGG